MPRVCTTWSVTGAFALVEKTKGLACRCRVMKDDGTECGRLLSKQADGGSSNLRQHVKRVHADNDEEKFLEVLKETITRIQEGTRKRQRTLTTEDFCEEELTAEDAAIDWIIHDGLPLCAFESLPAARAMKLEEPIPARTIGRRIEERLEDALESISKELRHQHSLVLASDIWTASEGSSFIAVFSVHITEKWQLAKRLIGFENLTGERHFGTEVASVYKCLMERLQIPDPSRRVVALVTDSASNMLRATNVWREEVLMTDPSAIHVDLPFCKGGTLVAHGCVVHMLHNTVLDGLKVEGIARVINDIQTVCKKARKSTVVRRHLDNAVREAGATPLQPQISNATRWHSTAGMIERFQRLKTELKTAYTRLMEEQETTMAQQDAAKSVATMNRLTGADSTLIEQLSDLLTNIRTKGRAIEDDSTGSSMSSVLTMYFDLIELTFKADEEDCDDIVQVKQVMAAKLVQRLRAVDPGMTVIAAAVHPGFMRICRWNAGASRWARPGANHSRYFEFYH